MFKQNHQKNYGYAEKGCLKILESHRFLNASLEKLSTTLKLFPSLDANGMEDKLFKTKISYPYERKLFDRFLNH